MILWLVPPGASFFGSRKDIAGAAFQSRHLQNASPLFQIGATSERYCHDQAMAEAAAEQCGSR